MIKKTTVATFRDGGYAGEYDWQGGIPLSIGEKIDISTGGTIIHYKLVNKSTTLEVLADEQIVTTRYWFEEA
jgi:hypothetical protein